MKYLHLATLNLMSRKLFTTHQSVSPNGGLRYSKALLAFVSGVTSLTLWSSPVGAAPLTHGSCFQLQTDSANTLYGKIGFSSISATIDGSLADGLELIWSLVPTDNFGLTLTFYGDSNCTGAYALAPDDICFEFSASAWSPVLDAVPSFDDSSSYTFNYDTSGGVSFVDDANNPLSLDETYYTVDYPGHEYYMEWGEASPSTGQATFTMTLSQLNDDGTCTAGGGQEPEISGGFDLDVDIDHYRNRAAAEAGALPDTL